MSADLSVRVGPLALRNPVMVASGTFGYGDEFADIYDPATLGAIVTKGVSLRPRAGNAPPRITETPAGMLNSIGLENPGLDGFLRDKLPLYDEIDTAIVVNIFGETMEEYAELAARLTGARHIAGLELNISCPNVKCGGMEFGKDPATIEKVVGMVRAATTLPVLVKLSPNVSDVGAVARAAEAGGADALCLVNTLQGMAIDVRTRQPKIRTIAGGLSGPAIRPIAVHQVHTAKKAVKIPIVGMGGIQTADDAVEFFLAGASAIQVGTANFRDPLAPIEILEALPGYLERYGMTSIGELCGAMLPLPAPAEQVATAVKSV
ncbi:MAG: dihydroorotate dehydrogenase [Acidobacteriota bacterium]